MPMLVHQRCTADDNAHTDLMMSSRMRKKSYLGQLLQTFPCCWVDSFDSMHMIATCYLVQSVTEQKQVQQTHTGVELT
jgi:hypothetical protein